MATKYVRTNGADGTGGHDGSTPALAWLTLGYAMTNVTAGDTIYVGAGTYRLSATIAPSSMGSMTYLYGDTDGSKTGDAGEVVVTTYTGDTSVPATVPVFTFASKNYWTLGKLTIAQGSVDNATNGPAIYITGTSANLTFQDLTIEAYGQGVSARSLTFGTVMNLIVERCRIFAATSPCVEIYFPSSASGSQIDAAITVRNCLLIGYFGVQEYTATTNTYRTGGLSIINCTVIAGANGLQVYDSVSSTTYPVLVYNSLIQAGLTALTAGAASMMTEDYNVILALAARGNVSAGTNSIASGARAWRFSMGHENSFGASTRPFGEFPAGSPVLTWGGTSVPTLDLNGVARPASGAASTSAALGPFERSNSATKETGTVRTGSNAIKIAGPGYQDFALPVAAASTTVTVYVRWDATYAGTKPKMQVLNGGECGVADATATATGSSGAWEQLSLNFTPTAVGIVTIRLLSSDTNGGGAMFADDFAVA